LPGVIRRRVAGAILGGLVAAGCSSSSTVVDVFAASSLTDAFTELEIRFEAENPDIDLRLNLAGSDTLRRQIDDGADADVFAPASIELFEGLDAEPNPYASNQLEVITTTSIDPDLDLTEPGAFDGFFVARCAPGVPCGDATDRLVELLGLDLGLATVTSEANVRAVLTKVELGEADVGFVYRTDAMAGGDRIVRTGLTSPEASVTLALATLDENSPEAQRFTDFVLSSVASEVFAALGFAPAP
jgi:molybdate transport system substrate-binding protein